MMVRISVRESKTGEMMVFNYDPTSLDDYEVIREAREVVVNSLKEQGQTASVILVRIR